VSEDPRREAEALLDEAEALGAEGDYEAALTLAAAARAELETAGDASSAELARVDAALALAHRYLGHAERAAELAARAIAALGEHDPRRGVLLHLMATILLDAGAVDDALPLLELAAAILDAAGPAERHEFFAVLLSLAEVTRSAGHLDGALALVHRVLDELAEIEPTSAEHAALLNGIHAESFLRLGSIRVQTEMPREAKDYLARAVEFAEAAWGHGHPSMQEALGEVAALYRVMGDEAAADAAEAELAGVERIDIIED
jgi:tetratricopeptide (TPR) repeat protein